MYSVTLFLSLFCVAAVHSACPYASAGGHIPFGHPPVNPVGYNAPDYDAVAEDIKVAMRTPQDFWPPDPSPDGANYGPFFIRLAWHCTGSYRVSDGRGGCDGGNIRYEPVRSWEDNTNLDKAIRVLEPIKAKYGEDLTWGDLIVLAGTTAIGDMGGPVLGFCGGRIDFHDGYESLTLGPTPEQEAIAPCPVQGHCQSPLGTSTVGLIYVNPQGFMANGNPSDSVPQIRDIFGRMSMNDVETVALIAGGHTFGRTHGACPLGAGPSPREDPYNPWPGMCSEGTFTSGIDGPWTTRPTQWDTEYLSNLLNYKYTLETGPGGAYQWSPSNGQNTMMMTTDMALLEDDNYKSILEDFLSNPSYYADSFAKVWYKLVTRDMGPVTRCVGDMVPPAQPFQNQLPSTKPTQKEINEATNLIKENLFNGSASFSDDTPEGDDYQGALFVQLAWQSYTTFRATDYRGGPNGAAIRFPPQSTWSDNQNMDKMLQQIEHIRNQMANPLSYADTIVLAGTVALEEAGNVKISFCGGRGDATDGNISVGLQPRDYVSDPILSVRDTIDVMGLNNHEYVALAGRPRSPAYMEGLGYSGSWTSDPAVFSNEYFKTLLDNTWTGPQPFNTYAEYSNGKGQYITGFDLAIVYDPQLRQIAMDFIHDNTDFLDHFRRAWVKAMNSDRFDGPDGNVCP